MLDTSTPATPKFPQVSILIPVYNAERFLVETVASVHAQTFQDWEALLILDPQSFDRSDSLCEELAATDPRIRVLHAPHPGVFSVRNFGLRLRSTW